MALKSNKPTETLKDEAEVVEQVQAPETETAAAEDDSIAHLSEDADVETVRESLPANPQGQQVAVVGSGANVGLNAFLKQLEAAGFEGLKLEFGTIPLVSLDKGDFKINDQDLGPTKFQGVPLSSKPKWCYRPAGNVPQDLDEQAWADTADAHLQPESEVAKAIAEWKEKGWSFKQQEYGNVAMYVHHMPAAPEYEGGFVLLSVSPTSVKLYTAATIKCANKGRMPYECLFEVGAGQKIKGEKHNWIPWDFKVLGSLQKLGITLKFGQVDENF